MRHQGSKLRTADPIAAVLQAVVELAAAPRVGELFCGSGAVSRALLRRGLVIDEMQDARPALIACYRALRDGEFDPPATLTRERYEELRRLYPDDTTLDPIAAFALIFCSYGGAWAGGYITTDERWPGTKSQGASREAAARARRDLLSMVPLLRATTLWCGDYRERCEDRPPGSVLYADPPFKHTKAYKGRGKFDHATFWIWARAVSRRHFLIVSEDIVPEDWRPVVQVLVQSPGLRRAQRIERAHVLVGGLADQIIRDNPQVGAFTLAT